ncbi:putative vacuolar protein sorting-associated protein [Helianthus annuus]|uniref:Putative VPS54 n=1 Tax=Helianthus annuus TaxID=4232 RepID=A0A251V1E9_HELAN|nr:vacuolar protein sorting-associated protein 54, chloroplastic isoform X1 [Helianthus annuus]KAF5811438.1 putative vacuolar protein sorting-associated protein [Helianthus annuus]KAJ0758694.1 putative vacuolar protein sorting-associated protein [Helianthus annuus]
MDPKPPLRSTNSTANRHNSSTSSLLSKSLSDASTQSLSSILNNPHLSDGSWSGWWSSSTAAVQIPEFAPPVNKTLGFEITRSDFTRYVSSISDHYNRFEDIRNHSNKENRDEDAINSHERAGEALVACLREVPALYFKEDFALEDGATFRAASTFSTVAENAVLQEKLSQYLDVVEVHLVKEISLRSNSFFEAQSQLEDLSLKIVEGCGRIRELKETIRLLDVDLVDSARQVQDLNLTRSNLLALQEKLRLILYVNQSLAALKLLVASADCAGALDVTDDLKNFLDADQLTGLHCFRHLEDHVAAAIDSVNSILSAEFLRVSINDAGDKDAEILSKAKARIASPGNGEDNEVYLQQEEDTSSFHDRLLPLIIGLLRTAKLPTVLRVYRDTVTSNMKTVIKSVVAELLPVLLARPLDSDFKPGDRIVDADGGGSSLASKLRSMSSESFVQLLGTIFKIVQAHLHRAAEVKKAIEWIMSNLDGHYAADSVAAAIAHGALTAEMDSVADTQSGSFPISSQKNVIKVSPATTTSNLSKNFRADVLRENTEAVFAACDAAHGRWAKLLGVRAILHPRLRLTDFLNIYNVSQEFVTATEKIGGRLGYSIRGTLQSQTKAFVDFQHESRMTKLKAVLDQETWVEVDVPVEFQAIVDSLFSLEDDNSKSIANSYNEMVASSEEQPSQSVDGITENNSKTKDAHGKSSIHLISFRGVDYHMVNCGLILLKMLSEYIEMNTVLPSLSSEVIHRVLEMLKFFNTRACQLVLGAGAMQVSGLKSITSKHLALTSQVVSFVHAIIPEIRRILFLKVPEARKGLLSSEIERVSQDYKVHRDEIHTKLVQIMRERLLVHLRGLPQIIETWSRVDETDVQPSQFARSLTKEVGYLQRVLSRTLHEADVQEIFKEVTIIFDIQISDAFSHVDISIPQAKARLNRDIEHILGCIKSLPSAKLNEPGTPVAPRLESLVQRISAEPDQ